MKTAIEQLVDSYLTSLESNGAKPKTVHDGYGYPLRRVFLPFLEAEGIAEPVQVTTPVLERLSARLRTSGGARKDKLSESTVHTYLRNIGFMLNWARAEGIEVPGTLGPVRNQSGAVIRRSRLKAPQRTPIVILERDEIDCMEDMAERERDKLIVRVLADTGIRVGELCGLQVADLDPAGFLRVIGSKDEAPRMVPLQSELQTRLTNYVTKRRPPTAVPNVFLGYARAAGEYRSLTPSGVQQLVRGLAEQCVRLGKLSSTKRVHPHIFRHSFASWCLIRGMDSVTLSRILGHRSLRMIQEVYAHLKPVDTRAALLKVFGS
jgi:integrase